jgi:hypothetical protein
MHDTIIQIYAGMVRRHGCSVDTILETPEFREEYLIESRRVLGHLPERTLLHHLTNLRKRGKLPRSREGA